MAHTRNCDHAVCLTDTGATSAAAPTPFETIEDETQCTRSASKSIDQRAAPQLLLIQAAANTQEQHHTIKRRKGRKWEERGGNGKERTWGKMKQDIHINILILIEADIMHMQHQLESAVVLTIAPQCSLRCFGDGQARSNNETRNYVAMV